MTTEEHIGTRLAAEMKRLGLKPPYVGEVLGIKTQSVYDLMKTGRIKKERIPLLTKLNDQPMEWWIGYQITPTAPPAVEQVEVPYVVKQNDLQEDAAEEAQLLNAFKLLPKSERAAAIESLALKAEHYMKIYDEYALRLKALREREEAKELKKQA